MSQSEAVLRRLQRKGSITALQAFKEIDCMRLAARVHDLRSRGYQIETEQLELKSGKTIARYRYYSKPQKSRG